MGIFRFSTRLRSHAVEQPDRLAICTDTQSLTYGALPRRVEEAAAGIQASQIGPGAVVGVTLSDEVEHLVVSLALMALGARQISLPTFDTSPVRVKLAERVRATHVIAPDDEFGIEGTRLVKWRGREPSPATTGGLPREVPEAVLYLKTSGTTGDVNIVAFTESQIGAQAERHAEYASERLLRLASIEHNNSKRHRLYCVWAGGTNVFRPDGAIDVAAFCHRHQVTCLDISRMHLSDLIASGDEYRLAGIKLRTGGSAVPIDLRRSAEERVTRNLYVRYAATECGAIAAAMPGEHDDDETVGRPLAGVELEIVGPEGPLEDGERGEIRLRSHGMATGYLDSPGETAKRFRDGWFYPGDMGALRSDGRLIVCGRKDDMIILNGLNIFPAQIERVLERHPAVGAAAALPLPSRVHGQIPVAAVELKGGLEVMPAELQRYARQALALHAPRRVLVMERLPRNGQGKILKSEIAIAFQTGKARP